MCYVYLDHIKVHLTLRTIPDACSVCERHNTRKFLFMGTTFRVGYGLYQQNNALCHEVWIIMECFWVHAKDSPIMFWNSNSSDISPSEHLDLAQQRVGTASRSLRNVWEYEDKVVTAWYQTYSDYLPTLCPDNVLSRIRGFSGGRGSYVLLNRWSLCNGPFAYIVHVMREKKLNVYFWLNNKKWEESRI